jgi:pimeloyl-ACP methyl ester carboxylesterase
MTSVDDSQDRDPIATPSLFAVRDDVVAGVRGALSVRDLGGDGPPVLLLHGAGSSLLAWSGLAATLAPRHRVIAMDLPGHGRSYDVARWEWDQVAADVAAVVGRVGAVRPALIGHSLGGLLAVRCASRDDVETSGVVNIDGFNVHDLNIYSPQQAADVSQMLMRLRSQRPRAGVDALTQVQVDELRQGTRERTDSQGGPGATDVEATITRCLRPRTDGRYDVGVDPVVAESIHLAVSSTDLSAEYRRLGCPGLVALASEPEPLPGEAEWVGSLQRTVSQAIARHLDELATVLPNLEVLRVRATHSSVLHNAELGAVLLEWLSGLDQTYRVGGPADARRGRE